MEISTAGKFLIVAGLVVAGLGVLFVVGSALGLGRLPGDFSWRRGNFRFYAPIASSILISIVVTVVLNVMSRR